MDKKVDLHLHTNASDGTWSNEELTSYLTENGIQTFSITDHDTISNSLKMYQTILPPSMKFIIGAEISSFLNGMRYHILSYGFDYTNKNFQQLLQDNTTASENWFTHIVKCVSLRKSEVSLLDYAEYKHDLFRGGYKVISYLSDRGILNRPTDFFPLAREFGAQPEYPSVQIVVDIIREAKGYSFLAHPCEYLRGSRMNEDELRVFLDLGVNGIECFHPSANVQDSLAYTSFCKRESLMISGGSDCHGKFIPERELGKPQIYEHMLDFSKLKSN